MVNKMKSVRILFVCLGNICRSPTAQGVFEKMLLDNRLEDKFEVDSCGTSAWHVGKPPDSRSLNHAKKRGYDFSHLRARQVNLEDFEEFDLILAMDESNYSDLLEISPHEYRKKIKLILDFGSSSYKSVPDPYYKGPEGFEEVLDLLEDACEGLINSFKDL